MLDFREPEEVTGGDLIPAGTLCWGYLAFKREKLANSDKSQGRFFEFDVTVDTEPYAHKHVYDMLCDPSDERNSTEWRKMAKNSFRRLMECTGFDINQMHADTPEQDRQMVDFIVAQLDGKRVALSVKIEEGQNGYQDKNKIAEFLSPNPDSSTHKKYQRLMSGAPVAQFGSTFAPPQQPPRQASLFTPPRQAVPAAGGTGAAPFGQAAGHQAAPMAQPEQRAIQSAENATTADASAAMGASTKSPSNAGPLAKPSWLNGTK